MKILKFYSIALVFSTVAFAESKFYAEAGVSYVALSGASYQDRSGLTVTSSTKTASEVNGDNMNAIMNLKNEDRSTMAPFLAVGYSFSDWLGMRLSYQYIGHLTAQTESETSLIPNAIYPPGALANTFATHYNDDVHLLSLAPEIKWPVTDKLKLMFSPQLNWVLDRSEVQESAAFYPARFSSTAQTRQKLSLGALVGAMWSCSKRCDLTASYQYADLNPSRGRQANIFSGAVRWRF
jgi:hypothetical protein